MTALRVTFAALVACASLTASAWWETQVTTNKWEYDGVEYLESSGTQYIDTGLKPFGAMNCEIVAHYSSTSYGYYTIIGSRNGSVSRYTMRMDNSSSGTGNLFQLSATDGASWSGFSGPTFAILRDGFHTLWKRDSSVGYDTTTCGTMSSTLTSDLFPYNHYLFALNNAGIAADFSVGLCIASAKQYTDGEILRHLVPVVHEGEGKMIDLCHNTLYANAGTGAFTYGAVTGKVVTAFDRITTNRVYHANPPQTAYDAANPWNAAERTRIGGDDTTLRPSAIIKEN